MRERKQIICLDRGTRREICPALLGTTRGIEKALVVEFGGESASALPPGGDWRCLSLSGVTILELREGPWHTGPGPTTAHTCIADIDHDIDISNGPRFQL